MPDVIKLDTIEQYNQLYGLETQHPQIAVVDLSKASRFPTHFTLNYGVCNHRKYRNNAARMKHPMSR